MTPPDLIFNSVVHSPEDFVIALFNAHEYERYVHMYMNMHMYRMYTMMYTMCR